MVPGRSLPGFYGLAVAAPFAATGLAFIVHGYLPRGNVSLVYLLAVLVVAARTSIRPALVCALLGFMLYNFFFTEPQYSLVMTHREDVLTVGFFLLMAALTGHQAARLRRQVLALEHQSKFARIQLDLLEDLAGAIDKPEILRGLYAALDKLPSVMCFIVEMVERRPEVTLGGKVLDEEGRTAVAGILSDSAGQTPVQAGARLLYALHDGLRNVAAVGLDRGEETPGASLSRENMETLISQASLALGRIRLARDLEKERMEKERELLRSALLTSVSHDLRTPLSSMIGSASSLLELDASLSGGQKRELQEAILQEANRLDGYIQKLLDMTRLGYGGLSLERDWTGLEDILAAVTRRIRPQLKGRKIKTRVPAGFPLLHVHAALIEQAIYNVIENAVRYSPPGGAIAVEAAAGEDKIMIDISDQGPGIPGSERERVFDMFYTMKRGDSHTGGTGLGLAICRGMLGAHGGEAVILDHGRGRGTVVRLTLPLPPQKSQGAP